MGRLAGRIAIAALTVAGLCSAPGAGAFVSPAWTAARTRRSILGVWRLVSVRTGGGGAPLGIADPLVADVSLAIDATTIRVRVEGVARTAARYEVTTEDGDSLGLVWRTDQAASTADILRETPTAMTMWITAGSSAGEDSVREWTLRLERE